MKMISCLGVISVACALGVAPNLPAQNKPAGESKPATPGKSGADKSEYRSIKEMIDIIPKPTFMQLKVQNKMDEAMNTANALFIQKAQNKAVAMKVRADGWQPWHYEGNPDAFTISVPYQNINVSGTAMGVITWISVSNDQRPALDKMPKGQEVAIAGQINRVFFTNTPPDGLQLHIDIGSAKLVRK